MGEGAPWGGGTVKLVSCGVEGLKEVGVLAMRHDAKVSMRVWRWIWALVCGGAVAIGLFEFVRLFQVFSVDSVLRLPRGWARAIVLVGAVASGLAGSVTAWFVARAASGPALMRRIGGCLVALGITVAVGGGLLFFVPLRSPVQPGRAPAGDVAGATIGLLIVIAGVCAVALGVLAFLVGLCWSWVRQRRQRAFGVS